MNARCSNFSPNHEPELCPDCQTIEALRRERDDLNALATSYGERIEQLQQERDAALAGMHEAEALVLSHEGRIEQLERENATLLDDYNALVKPQIDALKAKLQRVEADNARIVQWLDNHQSIAAKLQRVREIVRTMPDPPPDIWHLKSYKQQLLAEIGGDDDKPE